MSSEVTRRDVLQRIGFAALSLPAAVQAESAASSWHAEAASGEREYAAGDVLLPFSYSASPSPAAKPGGLDFSNQLGPDNCQVFIRIEDELWEFRSQWIINLGTTARYKGPDIDHLTRVEDGTYPPGMTSCWFLGGMWYDKSERKLYAPMHIEADGIRRSYPFSRKIALATSTDKGRTWHYEGDIVSSETYYYTHDFSKFSGSGYGIGVADFGFYVDERGGYFYVFPDEGWAPRTTRGMRWNSRAARCAINDKMKPGKWNYFYNGKWEESALGGRSCTVAPGHFWGVVYSITLKKYVCMFIGNQDPPNEANNDGVFIGCCSDLGKQDWVWGYCPEAMFGFMNLLSADGTDVAAVCDDAFRRYSYFGPSDFQRLDVKLAHGTTMAIGLPTRYMFEPHPESSDPVLGRRTKIVGCGSAEVKYVGDWKNRPSPDSYNGQIEESAAARSSFEYSFEGTAVYWRALRSPGSGQAEVYLDGSLRKTVDCYSPRSTSFEQFVYVNTGLAPNKKHTIKIVVTGKKHVHSTGAAISHIAIEYAAESYKASAGFSNLIGKNNWWYLGWKGTEFTELAFVVDEAHPKLFWSGEGCEIGANYQIPGKQAAVRKWVAPHGGVIRIEGTVAGIKTEGDGTLATIWFNSDQVWPDKGRTDQEGTIHDLKLTVIQGDAISFTVAKGPGDKNSERESTRISWDPVITYTQSVPKIWQPNPPSGRNLALNRYARSKVLVSSYRPFDAVDGDLNTAFTLHSDDEISTGDDWLQVDLEKTYRIDRYVISSQSADPTYRPTALILQKSDDGFVWTDVDGVREMPVVLAHYYGIPMTRLERSVPAFEARHVRVYLPKGKPFTISEFELYYTEGKTAFGPPIPAG